MRIFMDEKAFTGRGKVDCLMFASGRACVPVCALTVDCGNGVSWFVQDKHICLMAWLFLVWRRSLWRFLLSSAMCKEPRSHFHSQWTAIYSTHRFDSTDTWFWSSSQHTFMLGSIIVWLGRLIDVWHALAQCTPPMPMPTDASGNGGNYHQTLYKPTSQHIQLCLCSLSFVFCALLAGSQQE